MKKICIVILVLSLNSSIVWSIGEIPFLQNGQLPTLSYPQTVPAGADELQVVRSAKPGELGSAYVALWNKPGGYKNGAVVVSRLISGSQVKVTRQSADEEWSYIKSAENASKKGWCMTSQIYTD